MRNGLRQCSIGENGGACGERTAEGHTAGAVIRRVGEAIVARRAAVCAGDTQNAVDRAMHHRGGRGAGEDALEDETVASDRRNEPAHDGEAHMQILSSDTLPFARHIETNAVYARLAEDVAAKASTAEM
jgi:hypothetical protein